MLSTAALAIAAVVLMGCGASADDADDAPPASGTTDAIPTDQPTAAGGGGRPGSSEPPPDRPLAGLDPCGLISGDEAAQLELGEPQAREDACAWPYTGASDDVVYAIVALQHEQASLDHFIELGYVPVPGKLGNHEAAVGVLEDEGSLACQVPVVVGESAVKVGTASPGFSNPDDPLCGDLSNELARLIEPKLPVVDTSASARASDGERAGGRKSGKDGPLAQVQPCDLNSDDEAAQLGLTNEAGGEQAGARQCAWVLRRQLRPLERLRRSAPTTP